MGIPTISITTAGVISLILLGLAIYIDRNITKFNRAVNSEDALYNYLCSLIIYLILFALPAAFLMATALVYGPGPTISFYPNHSDSSIYRFGPVYIKPAPAVK